ncbi:hypothetical protein DL765_007062 [Monosporascus sp. GIB2]|nr:hypothetical protein DL765_007062 [Monosporascus sp. GIB2]
MPEEHHRRIARQQQMRQQPPANANFDTFLGSYETGFVTDPKPMNEAIELHGRKFWGGKKAHADGTWYSNRYSGTASFWPHV